VFDTNCAIEIAAASVIGRDHRRTDRPCQDAFAVRRIAGGVVAVVCDGCGGAAHSELGARLGAHLLASGLAARVAAGAAPDDDATWRGACDELLARLAGLAPALAADGDLAAAIETHLLFTVLAAVMTPDGAVVAAIGDGVVIVDGDIQVRTAPAGAPAYLAYRLLGGAAPLERVAAPAATAVVLATDGAAPLLPELPGLPADDRLFVHPDALRRRLAQASREVLDVDWAAGRLGRRGGLLTDDTTIVALRRRPSC
jgi:hypothetical protein